ncbi:single-stranded DNA-binding protein [Allobranchiibius sp. GilTou38]|uniref:single-stranded DNA-binding protein n=1 Tax=Allobranchiibius sp. GilTou38 TaxID=2815210 RepID=UPI001AA16B18|nr:single-stranded DNA-binding protein [Allobranchiibius sp. GilTou38]MBO1768230.1 single-stranded DNA-binding protein [Allobranchiibius sp. GilTou38]
MSYLIQTGNLTQAPELRQSKAGNAWTEARVIHNDYEQDPAGEWRETSSIPYTVRVFGRQAEQLVEAANANGNIAIQFAGRYTVRNFNRSDGSGGIAYEVNADTWAVMPGQEVQLRKSAPRQHVAAAGESTPDLGPEPPW